MIDAGTRIALKSILNLTDFSVASESALPFARTIARMHKSNMHVLHVMIPEPMACSTPETTAALVEAQQEIFRRSPIPVLTVGPSVPRIAEKGPAFSQILLAIDFLPECVAAASYATSLAQEIRATLIGLHVIRHHDEDEKAEVEAIGNSCLLWQPC